MYLQSPYMYIHEHEMLTSENRSAEDWRKEVTTAMKVFSSSCTQGINEANL